MVSETIKIRWYSCQHLRMIWLILVTHDLISVFRMVYINSFLRTHSLMFLSWGWTPLKGTSSGSWFVSDVACDHALSLYLCGNLFFGRSILHFFYRSHAKKPESGLFSDWIGNNTDDLRCSNWPKCRHPLVVVDFSLHFCLRNKQWIHRRVRNEISAGSVFLNLKNLQIEISSIEILSISSYTKQLQSKL